MAVSSLAVAAELVAVSMQGVEDGTEEKEERGVAVIHSWSSAMSMETYSTQRVVIPWGCSPNRLPCILQYLSPNQAPPTSSADQNESSETGADSVQTEHVGAENQVKITAGKPEKNPLVWSGETMMNALEEEDLWETEMLLAQAEVSAERNEQNKWTDKIFSGICMLIVAFAANVSGWLNKLHRMQIMNVVVVILCLLLA